MAFDRISDNLHRLNHNIQEFARSSAEYYKLDLFNKSMQGATSLVKLLVIGFFLLLSLFFISLAVSFWISAALDTPSSGFFIVGGFYLVLFFVAKFFGGKFIEKVLLVKFSKKYFREFDKNGEFETEDDDETL
ncbi:MAG TPA: phage holin family protein [Salinimicrobium sp.]|nr:phage holin family protein [Salinimicrobium sp.]